jgi:hypothetical protein
VVRPMYYAFPWSEPAYGDQGLHQFSFGPDVWVAPIAAPAIPAANTTGPSTTGAGAGAGAGFLVHGLPVTNWTLWVPPGTWVEWGSWEVVRPPVGAEEAAGGFMSRNYAMTEMPVYVRAGAILPMLTLPPGTSPLGVSSPVPTDITLYVFGGVALGAEEGATATTSTRLYDDDGATVAYLEGEYAWTTVQCTWRRGSAGGGGGGDTVSCTIHPPEGAGFRGMPARRRYALRFLNTLPPTTVAVNGAGVSLDPLGGPDAFGENAAWAADAMAWSYDGEGTSTWVRIGVAQPLAAALTVTLTFPVGSAVDDALATKGLSRKLARVTACKEEIDALYGAVFPSDVETMLNISAAASLATARPDAAAVRESLGLVGKRLRSSVRDMNAWRIPAGHKAKAGQNRCIAALQDAAAAPQWLPAGDVRVAAAMAPPQFKFTAGEHLTAPEPQIYGEGGASVTGSSVAVGVDAAGNAVQH